MSGIAVALKHMLAAGMPHDAIVAAVAEMEAGMAVDEVAERRRAYDRDRKRRVKEGKSGGIPVESADSAESTEPPLSRPPNENNSNPPTHTPENTTPRAKADPFPRPDWCETGLWADFLKCRKTKRLTNTATAHAGVLSDLADLSARTGWPPGRILAACVKKGWGAIYETDEMKEITGGKPKKRNGPASTIDAVQRAIELTGGPSGCDPAGSGGGYQRIGQVPDPVRAIGHVER
ncbi:MAG: hypothetical protein WA940_00325 [Sphingopyxis sp.]